MRTFLVLILCFFLNHSNAQIDSIEKRMIEATLEIRNAILGNLSDPNELSELVDRWSVIEPRDSVVSFLLFNAAYYKNILDGSVKRFKKLGKRAKLNSPLPDKITESDFTILAKNRALLFYIFHDFLESEFPHKLNVDSFKLAEVKFINVQPNEKVADIGTGVGVHLLHLAAMYPENEFIAQDIYTSLLETLIELNDLLLGVDSSIKFVEGKKDDLRLPYKVDKIILRNTFHHFKKKEKMLESISSYLNEDGLLIFIEPLKANVRSLDDCELKMDQSDVLKYVRSSSFEIIEETVVENTLFLSCKHK